MTSYEYYVHFLTLQTFRVDRANNTVECWKNYVDNWETYTLQDAKEICEPSYIQIEESEVVEYNNRRNDIIEKVWMLGQKAKKEGYL